MEAGTNELIQRLFAVVDETIVRKSTNTCKSCKSFVEIDASQLYPNLMCQTMPTGLHARWDIVPETSKFTPRQNKTRSFEKMAMSCFQRTRPDCITESFYTTVRQKKNDCFSLDGFCFRCITVFEAMDCFYHFCPSQELRPSLTEEDIKRGSRKRELDELRRNYKQEKSFTVIEMWKYEWWRLYKTTTNVELHIRENFPYRRTLADYQLLEGIKEGNLFGYVHCDIEVPKILRGNFANFPPIFKNTLVSNNDIGDLMKTYAKEEGTMSQPRKMLISSFTLQNGTLITPLLIFYLQLGLVCTKKHRFIEYTPEKCFNSVVQSAVDARRQVDENPNSSVDAETMKLLADNSYSYQIMNKSRQTVTNRLTDEKTHAAINSKLFKKLDDVDNSLCEVELPKAQIEHKEPIIVGFFILQYAKLRMLELYHNFFTKFCNVNMFEELETDTDSLYLALAEKELEDCIRLEMRTEWQRFRSNDCVDYFAADAVPIFSPEHVV